jgi:hypothetical protein
VLGSARPDHVRESFLDLTQTSHISFIDSAPAKASSRNLLALTRRWWPGYPD